MLGQHSLDGCTTRWVLFNIFISDLEQAMDCDLTNFAGDAKFGETADMP